MRKSLLTALIFVGWTSSLFGQKSTFSLGAPSAIGIEFSQGNEKNFLFDNLDYFYRSNTVNLIVLSIYEVEKVFIIPHHSTTNTTGTTSAIQRAICAA